LDVNYESHFFNRNPELRAIDWYINEFNQRRSGGGGVRGGFDFLGPPLQNFTGALSRNCNYIFVYLDSSAQAQSIGTLFE